MFFQQRNRAPSAGLVRATVEKLINSPTLNLTAVTPTVTPATESGQATVAYQAEAEVREPLYEAADAAAVLRDDLKLDPEAWQQTRQILSGKTAPRILELAGLKGVDNTLLQTTFLHETTAKGAKITFTGRLHAAKGPAGWELTSEDLTQSAGEVRGQRRSVFPGLVSVMDDPAEMKKIRDLAASQAGIPAKVEAGRQAFLAERRAEQEKIIAALLESLKPKTVYGGTAAADGGTPFPIFLEFTSLNTRSKNLAAWLRNDVSWEHRRALQGSYTYDADREVLVLTLETTARQAVPQGGPMLADEGNWRVTFQLSAGTLSASDPRHSFSLDRLSPEAATAAQEKIVAAIAAREQPLLAIIKADTAYPGVAQLEGQAPAEKIRLRFRQVAPHGTTVNAVLESLERPGVFREFRGTLDPLTKKLTLTSAGQGRTAAGQKGGLKFPPLVSSDGQKIIFAITDSALAGGLEGADWKLLLPFAGATTVSGDAGSDYPTKTGAYVWSRGAWQPLPRNDSQVSKNALAAIGGFLNALSRKSSPQQTGERVADLVFSGEDPVPAVDGADVLVLYVGPLDNGPAEKYPEINSYPELEVAPTTREANGHRKVALTRIASGLPVGGFRERRVPGMLERVSDTAIELSCARRLSPGTYAVYVNEEGFELNVE